MYIWLYICIHIFIYIYIYIYTYYLRFSSRKGIPCPKSRNKSFLFPGQLPANSQWVLVSDWVITRLWGLYHPWSYHEILSIIQLQTNYKLYIKDDTYMIYQFIYTKYHPFTNYLTNYKSPSKWLVRPVRRLCGFLRNRPHRWNAMSRLGWLVPAWAISCSRCAPGSNGLGVDPGVNISQYVERPMTIPWGMDVWCVSDVFGHGLTIFHPKSIRKMASQSRMAGVASTPGWLLFERVGTWGVHHASPLDREEIYPTVSGRGIHTESMRRGGSWNGGYIQIMHFSSKSDYKYHPFWPYPHLNPQWFNY